MKAGQVVAATQSTRLLFECAARTRSTFPVTSRENPIASISSTSAASAFVSHYYTILLCYSIRNLPP